MSKVHTTNEINHIHLEILLFLGSNCFLCIVGVTIHAVMHYLLKLSSSANPDLNFWVSKLSKNSVLGVQMNAGRIGGYKAPEFNTTQPQSIAKYSEHTLTGGWRGISLFHHFFCRFKKHASLPLTGSEAEVRHTTGQNAGHTTASPNTHYRVLPRI